MALFTETFKDYIREELNYRKSFNNAQDVFIPNVRVTALIQGSYKGQTLKGFTLGIPDTSLIKNLNSLTNVSNNGTTIGITYVNDQPTPVVIPSKKNLPSPGVTNVVISTQSRGGLIFKAVIDFKFYGKEQYDFIYQTFMRPGNPIVIEYGHTRTKGNLNNLNFFEALTQDHLDKFREDLRQLKPIEKTRNGGKVVGLVSNFNIKLNENNEYEAQIELINALEFMFSLPPKDTFLSYRDEVLSSSIRSSFGEGQNEDYDPELDRVFQLILQDTTNPTDYNQYKREILNPGELYIKIPEITISGTEPFFGPNNRVLFSKPQKHPDYYYVSLWYILNRLLPSILFEVRLDHGGGLEPIKSYPIPEIRFDKIGLWPTLRSVNTKDLIINNKNLYEGELDQVPPIFLSRNRDYIDKFESSDIVRRFFKINYNWSNQFKSVYGERETEDGIFVNYNIVRNSFLDSYSVSEAIIKILDSINLSTNNVLNLKLRMMPIISTVGSGEFVNINEEQPVFQAQIGPGEEKLGMVIYDQNKIPPTTELNDIYVFYENNVSEAISYQFDFSLPSTVSATIIANNFRQEEQNIIGDAETEQLIKNGYVDTIKSLVNETILLSSEKILPNLTPVNVTDTNTSGSFFQSLKQRIVDLFDVPYSEAEERAKEILKNEGEMFSEIIGYKELFPPGMKVSVIKSGLFNVLPTSAKITIRLQGLDGFRFGDMFGVKNMLPEPYDQQNVFLLTGYKHTINSDIWITEIDGQMIGTTPDDKKPQ